MGQTAAALTGFIVGSVVSALATYWVIDSTRKKKQKRAKAFADATSSRTSLRKSVLANDVNINLMSDITSRLWSHLNVAGSKIIKETAEPMFKELMPKPLQGLHFTKIDLGKVPFRFDNIVVHPLSKKDGTVQFDMDVIWDGHCDVQLKAGSAIKFGVRNFKMFGRMQFLMKPLTDDIPCFGGIQYAFINPPLLDIDFTGLANVADFSMIYDTIRSIMNDTMASMIVLPNRMMTKMDYSSSFLDAYVPPVGVARITVMSGHGFKIQKQVLRKDDIPDVYVNVTLGSSKWKTSVQKDNCTPTWDESGDFLLSDKDQILTLHAWDEDKGPLDKDDDMGVAQVTISEILLAGKTMEVELLQPNKKGTGSYLTIHCDILNLTTTAPETGTTPSLTEKPPARNHLGGLVTILITGAYNVPVKKEKASSYIKVTYGDAHEFVTGIVVDAPGYDALNPLFDMAFHVPLTSDLVAKCVGVGDLPSVVLQLMNGPGTGDGKDQVLGSTKITYKDLMHAPNQTIQGKREIGTNGASVECMVSLSYLDVGSVSTPSERQLTASSSKKLTSSSSERSGSIEDTASSVTPSLDGAEAATDIAPAVSEDQEQVKVTMVKGYGFKTRKPKKKLFGKADVPDVYCLVKFGSKQQEWRTATIKNSITPAWNESQTYVLSHRNEVIQVGVYDENRKGEDYLHGHIRVTVGQVMLEGGTMEVEIEKDSVGIGAYIVVNCEVV